MTSTKYVEGSIWGRKQIIERAGVDRHGGAMYLWRCLPCGSVRGPATGTTISRSPFSKCCPRRGMEKVNYLGYHGVTGEYIAKVKASARKRGIAYEVTAQYLWDVWIAQSGICTYTGRQLVLGVDASLDRIDSSQGYVQGNVQWLHKDVNKVKWEFTEQAFIALCAEIVDHVGKAV